MTTQIRVFVLSHLILFGSYQAIAGDVRLTKPEDVGMSSERLLEIVQRLGSLIDEGQTGGMQILISRRGKVVLHKNFGFTDIASRRSVDNNTLFRIHSMTKPVTAVAMMMMYEDGHFSFSDPISKHIPEFSDLQVYAGQNAQGKIILEDIDQEPTIHDLMQHTAGFSYDGGDHPVAQMYADAGIRDNTAPLQEMIDKLAKLPLRYQPRTQWVYSFSMDIQGYLVEKWSGMDIDQLLQERLFTPLGMDETMAWVPRAKSKLLATVYTRNDANELIRSRNPANERALQKSVRFMGGGQLISTSDDYWRFCQMLLNGGEYDGHRIILSKSVSAIMNDSLPDGIEMSNPGIGFGINGIVITDESVASWDLSNGTYSWSGAASTTFWIDPQEELIVIFMTQYRPWESLFYYELLGPLVRS